MVSDYLERQFNLIRNFDKIDYIKILSFIFLITLIPAILIFKQPDLGTSMVIISIIFAILFASGLQFKLFYYFIIFIILSTIFIFFNIGKLQNAFILPSMINFLLEVSTSFKGILVLTLITFTTGMIVFLLLKFFSIYINFRTILIIVLIFIASNISGNVVARLFKPYQQARLLSFIVPQRDTKGEGWNVIQSKISVGSGSIFGKGFRKGTQNKFAFLPARHTDFIFAVYSEEFGFIGSFLLIILYSIFLTQIINVIVIAPDITGKLCSIGIFTLFFIHIIINIGMTLGLFPVCGIPLPFFSYGGSFIIVSSFSAGIILNISKQPKLNY
jgi:rod shape determining protein RodA